MKHFGYGILTGFLAVIGGLAMTFAVIPVIAPASAPAPPITNLVHLDEKLRFLRNHPAFEPSVLAVGSSVTWRQLSGQAFEAPAGGPYRFLNGGTGYLQIHQTRALTRFFLDHYDEVRTVLVMVGLSDFRDCTDEPRELFAPKDAARYSFGGWPALYFHLRYFSPGRYVKTVLTRAGRQTPFSGDLYNDRYGSGPVDLPDDVDLGIRYRKIDTDPACVGELVGLAQDVNERGIRLALVFPPVHPQYRARYAGGMEWLAGIATRLEQHGRRNRMNLTVVDLIGDASFEEKDFYDAFHLQWPAVRRLSARIVQAIDVRLPHSNKKIGFPDAWNRPERAVAPPG